MEIKNLDGTYEGAVINHVLEEWGDPIVTRVR